MRQAGIPYLFFQNWPPFNTVNQSEVKLSSCKFIFDLTSWSNLLMENISNNYQNYRFRNETFH